MYVYGVAERGRTLRGSGVVDAPVATVEHGSLAAIVNCVNLLAGVAAPIVTGFIVDTTGHFLYAFIIGGVALIGGLASYLLLMGKIEAIPAQEVAVAAED